MGIEPATSSLGIWQQHTRTGANKFFLREFLRAIQDKYQWFVARGYEKLLRIPWFFCEFSSRLMKNPMPRAGLRPRSGLQDR